jgi:hypothetical protein
MNQMLLLLFSIVISLFALHVIISIITFCHSLFVFFFLSVFQTHVHMITIFTMVLKLTSLPPTFALQVLEKMTPMRRLYERISLCDPNVVSFILKWRLFQKAGMVILALDSVGNPTY